MKKIIAFTLALTLCLGLTGCGLVEKLLGVGGAEDLSYEHSEYDNPGSFCYSVLGKLSVDAGPVKVPMKLEVNGRSTREPNRSCADISVGAMTIQVENKIYSEELDGVLYTYIGTKDEDEIDWETDSTKMGDTDITMEDLPEFLQKLTEMEKTGTAKAATGDRGDFYEGYINADRIDEALDFLLSMEPGKKSQEAREEIDEMLQGMDPDLKLPTTVIIEGDRVLEIYLDLMPIADQFLEETEDREAEITEFCLRVNFWNYDSAEPITIPAEARN